MARNRGGVPESLSHSQPDLVYTCSVSVSHILTAGEAKASSIVDLCHRLTMEIFHSPLNYHRPGHQVHHKSLPVKL